MKLGALIVSVCLAFCSLFIPLHAVTAGLSDGDAKAIIIAKVHHAKPDIVQNTGESVGLVKYCPSISAAQYTVFVQNSLKWIKLGSTEFENLTGAPGFLNNRMYSQLQGIFNNALSKGERDAKMMRRHPQYKRQICPELLDDDSLSGPPLSAMRLIVER